MSDKTKEEIIWEEFADEINGLIDVAGEYFITMAERAMQAYADQEKRKEAIAFAEWSMQNDAVEGSTAGQMYDTFIASQPSTPIQDDGSEAYEQWLEQPGLEKEKMFFEMTELSERLSAAREEAALYRRLLVMASEGYSDEFTNSFNDEIDAALNKYPSPTPNQQEAKK